MEEISQISFESKDKVSLPKGAKVLKKSVRTTVEEIENGFLIVKSYDVKYSVSGNTDWMYYTKRVYSETNPIKIEEEKRLADFFE